MALRDAWYLAEQLMSHKHATLAGAVAAYDGESMPRSKKALEGGRFVLRAVTQQGWKHFLVLVVLRIVGWLMRLSGWWSAGSNQQGKKVK